MELLLTYLQIVTMSFFFSDVVNCFCRWLINSLFRDPDLRLEFVQFVQWLMAVLIMFLHLMPTEVYYKMNNWISHATFHFFVSQQQSFFFQEKSSHQASATAVAPQRVPVDPGKVDRLNNWMTNFSRRETDIKLTNNLPEPWNSHHISII